MVHPGQRRQGCLGNHRHRKTGGAAGAAAAAASPTVAQAPAQPPSSDARSTLIQYGILVATTVFVGVMLYYFSDDPAALTGRTYLYATLLLVVLFAAAIYAYRGGVMYDKDAASGGWSIRPSTLMVGAAVAVAVAVFAYVYVHAPAATVVILTFFLNMVLFLMVLVALVFLGNVATNYLKRSDGILAFLLEFIFYIPCLLSAGARGLWADWKMTPPLSAVLLAFELVLILAYLYVPVLIQRAVTPSGAIVLQGPPVFLDQGAVTVGTSDAARTSANSTVANNILPQGIGGDPPASQYNADYALSLWVAVNPGGTASTSTQVPNGVEAPVFSYGTPTSYKPRMNYDVGRDVYSVEVAPDMVVSGLRVANQKWNQWVFNYSIPNQMIDIYINGQLARSTPMRAEHPITFAAADQFTVGGPIPIYGSVGNVTYYPHSLTPYQIAQLWNTHTALNLNPPESALKYPSTGISST